MFQSRSRPSRFGISGIVMTLVAAMTVIGGGVWGGMMGRGEIGGWGGSWPGSSFCFIVKICM